MNSIYSLPRGAGYKSEWLVVDGTNQEKIVQKLKLARCRRVSYGEGLKIIGNEGYSSKVIMICPDYNGQNYIFGSCIVNFLYDPDRLAEVFGKFYRVYMYATMRVSEAHYFGLIEKGEILRYYRFDDEDIISIGDPLPRELAQGINLPKSLEELDSTYGDDDSNFTDMDEEIIINLASGQTGVDEDDYPYDKEVIIGVMP